MKKITSLLLVSMLFCGIAMAQKIKVLNGDVTAFKGKTELNIQYDYSTMGVGKFKNEADYVDKKVSEYNAKEAGKGDAWAEAWVNDRSTRYEPKFEELFEKNTPIELDGSGSSDYTLTFKTTFIEPGFNIGLTKKPASMNGELILTDASGKELVKIAAYACPGSQAMGFDFDSGTRISESYAKCAKSLGKYIAKKGLK